MTMRVKTIPHEQHRYPTVGDWWWDGDTLEVRVSKLSDPRYEQLVAVHEIIEALLCRARGIAEADVTTFDIAFENARPLGSVEEPGDSPEAPYHAEHVFATTFEIAMAAQLGVDWTAYENEIETL